MSTPLAALLALAAITAPGAAQAVNTATPNGAGKGTRLHPELDARRPPVSGRIPTETTLSVQEGYRFDPKAVARRCTADQAEQDACPAASAVGTAEVTAAYAGYDVVVPIRLYLAKPQQAGDLAGVAAVATLLGSTRSTFGRVVRTTEAPFGLSVVLPTPGGDVSGYPITFKAFKADIGARRVVKQRVGRRTRRVRRSLITNPRTCDGTWASRARFTFGDGSTAAVDAPIACSA